MSFETESLHKSFGGSQGVYSHFSPTLSCNMQLSVYLPERVNGKKLPVLYYLSGLTCTQDNVTTKAGFQKYANEHGIIVVCPDTSPRGTDYHGEHDSYDFGSGAGFYLNATQAPWSNTYLMYDYIVDELPALIASEFPIDSSLTGIFGHSMGGHGALTIGLRNPFQFKSISAFAPIVAPTQCPWGKKAFSGYLGENSTNWKDYDATELVKTGHKTQFEILIDQGSVDQFLQSQLMPEKFAQACEKNDQPLELRTQDGYDHSYYLMNTFMEDHIRFHAKNFDHLKQLAE